MTYDYANQNVYVGDENTNTVSVIDGRTDTIADTITVGLSPRGTVYDLSDQNVYTANFGTTVAPCPCPQAQGTVFRHFHETLKPPRPHLFWARQAMSRNEIGCRGNPGWK